VSNKRYNIVLTDEHDQMIKTDVTYAVCDVGTGTLATIYDSGGTAKTNPVTTTVYAADGGMIDFYSAAATCLICIASDRTSTVLKSVPASMSPTARVGRRVQLRQEGTGRELLVWPFALTGVGGTSTDETSLGVKLPVGAVLNGNDPPWFHLYTVASAAMSADLGLDSSESNGDADGLIDGQKFSIAGILDAVGTIGDGSTPGYLLGELIASNLAASGLRLGHNKIITVGECQTVTIKADTAVADAAGFVVIPYTKTNLTY